MFQSILKKVNETLDSDSIQQVIQQASSAQSAITARLSPGLPHASLPSSSSSSSDPSTTAKSKKTQEQSEDEEVWNALDGNEKIELLIELVQQLKTEKKELTTKTTRLESQTSSLETQLKDLRLKAKLKITQLQRELDATRQSGNDKAIDGAGASGEADRDQIRVLEEKVGEKELVVERLEKEKEDEFKRRVAAEEKIGALESRIQDLESELLIREVAGKEGEEEGRAVTEETARLMKRIRELEEDAGVKSGEMETMQVRTRELGERVEELLLEKEMEPDKLKVEVNLRDAELAEERKMAEEVKIQVDAYRAKVEELETLNASLKLRVQERDVFAEDSNLGEKGSPDESALREQLSQSEALYREVVKARDAAVASADAATSELERAKAEGEAARARLEVLTRSLDELKSVNEALQLKVNALESGGKDDGQDSGRDEIRMQLEAAVQAKKGSDQKVDQLQKQLETANLKISSLEAAVASNAGASDLQHRLSQYETIIADLKLAKDLAATEIESLEAKLATSQADTARLAKSLESISSESAKLKGQLVEMQEKHTESRAEVEKWKAVVLEKEKMVVEVKREMEEAKKGMAESEVGKAFLMDEQIMDLKLQIANRQKEAATLQDALQKSQAENDRLSKDSEEKIRKLKGLLGQASKTLQETKKSNVEKDAEIERLNTELDRLETNLNEVTARDDEQKRNIERLLVEIQDERELATVQSEELHRRVKELESELQRVRSEFQSYKLRAHTALQQNATGVSEQKVAELEEMNARLLREKMDSKQEIASLNERLQAASSELNASLDQLAVFESQIKRFEGSSRELTLLRMEVEACNQRIEADSKMHAEALRSKESYYRSSIEALKQENAKAQTHYQEMIESKESELRQLQKGMDELRNQLVVAKEEASTAIVEANRAKAAAAQASAAAATAMIGSGSGSFSTAPSSPRIKMASGQGQGGGFFSMLASPGPGSLNAAPAPGNNASPVSSRRESIVNFNNRESFADLMGRRTSVDTIGLQNGASASKERELLINFEKVSELLAEAEEQIKRYSDQEKVLKEEIRKFERAEKRNELLVKQQNVEYLKNIVLSFLETNAKEQLLPVIAKVLELSPDEVKRVKGSIMGLEDDNVRANLPNFGLF